MWRKLLSFASDVTFYGLGTVIGQIVSFLMLPLYTRYLSPVDYGVLAMLSVASMLFLAIAPFGVGEALFRRFNRSKEITDQERSFSTAVLSVFATTSALVIVGFLAKYQLAELLTGDSAYSLLVFGTLLSAAISAMSELARSLLRIQRRVKTLALCNVAKTAVSIGLTATLIVGFEFKAGGYVIGTLAAESRFFLVHGSLVRKHFRPIFDVQEWKAMLNYGLPIVPHRCLGYLTIVTGQYLVRTGLGLEEAGIYDIAMKFSLPLGVVINAIQSAWVPYKFEVHANEKDPEQLFRSVFTYYIALVSALWVFSALWLPDILKLMTTLPFHGAATILPIVLLSRLMTGVYFMLGSGIELTDNTKPMSLVSAAGFLSVLGFSLLLIPPLGAGGAAYASCLSWGVMSIVAFRIAQSRIRIAYEWRAAISIFVVGAIVIVAASSARELAFMIRIPLLAGLSVTFLLVAAQILLSLSVEGPRIRRRIQLLRQRATRASAVDQHEQAA
jgi:O-antigen/teichoic acid export membrane protein